MISHALRLTLDARRMIWSALRSSALSKSFSARMESSSAGSKSSSAYVESLSAGSESFSALSKSTSALSESFSAHPKSSCGCLWLRSGALVSAVCSGGLDPRILTQSPPSYTLPPFPPFLLRSSVLKNLTCPAHGGATGAAQAGQAARTTSERRSRSSFRPALRARIPPWATVTPTSRGLTQSARSTQRFDAFERTSSLRVPGRAHGGVEDGIRAVELMVEGGGRGGVRGRRTGEAVVETMIKASGPHPSSRRIGSHGGKYEIARRSSSVRGPL
jgi:hypothetical protein